MLLSISICIYFKANLVKELDLDPASPAAVADLPVAVVDLPAAVVNLVDLTLPLPVAPLKVIFLSIV